MENTIFFDYSWLELFAKDCQSAFNSGRSPPRYPSIIEKPAFGQVSLKKGNTSLIVNNLVLSVGLRAASPSK
jgi:hypothetical protein